MTKTKKCAIIYTYQYVYLHFQKNNIRKEYIIMEEQNNGSIKISEEVIATIASNAALEIDGVASVLQKVLPSTKSVAGNIKNVRKGVGIVRNDEGLELTVQIVVKNGYKIPDVSLAAQTNVKETVANMTGINVTKTNIIVAGVVEEKAKKE